MNEKDIGTYTNCTDESAEPLTLETLSRLMLTFADRRPAPVVGVAIHPNYQDLFAANLREEGFVKARTQDVPQFAMIPIVVDESVPEGEYRLVYRHTFGSKMEGTK